MVQRTGKSERDIVTYAHTDKSRVNNPPVGLVTPETDRNAGRVTYTHDPHLDPQFPWAGKTEHTSFEVPTFSLHVHERIDPRTIIDAVRKRKGAEPQLSLFAAPGENPPIRQAIEFYKHRHNWSNRLITCDTSRVAVSLAKQRLITANFAYYELARSEEGMSVGFRYRGVPKVSAGTLAYDEPPNETVLYDQPLTDRTKARVTGPFTIEAVPAPAVRPLDDVERAGELPADHSMAQTGPTVRQGDWRDELLKTGIRGKAGQRIPFARLEPLPGTRWLYAEGEIRPDDSGIDGFRSPASADEPARLVVSFGSDHAPLEQRQVALAIEEALNLVPKSRIIVFAAFLFDLEAFKDVDETQLPGVTLLKAKMTDLLTDDLKEQRASNESFWLIGQPDVEFERIANGEDKGKFRVSVLGFDYYNAMTDNVESGGTDRIALWMLDPDYDGRSLFSRQVFFPMAGCDSRAAVEIITGNPASLFPFMPHSSPPLYPDCRSRLL